MLGRIDSVASLGLDRAVSNVSAAEHVIDDHASEPPPPRKPAGRTERGRQRQRAQIEAARDLFIAHGYRGTTLEAIIARAGGSRETIYRVFGGKRGLFGAIIAQAGAQLADSMAAPVAASLPPREGLTRLGRQLVAIWQSDEGRAINRVVVSEGLEAPDLVDAWYKGGPELSIGALAHYLDAQIAEGHLTMLDSRLVARQFVMLLMGEMAIPMIAKAPQSPDAETQIQRCVDLILLAYQPLERNSPPDDTNE